ncbi:MAG: hypothetical protein ACM37W_18765 [Actinomycetota bacterium]
MIPFDTHLLSLEELLINIASSRQITAFDFNFLSLVLLSGELNEEDKRAVQRVFHALRRGWLTLIGVSDEQQLSTIKVWAKTNAGL